MSNCDILMNFILNKYHLFSSRVVWLRQFFKMLQMNGPNKYNRQMYFKEYHGKSILFFTLIIMNWNFTFILKPSLYITKMCDNKQEITTRCLPNALKSIRISFFSETVYYVSKKWFRSIWVDQKFSRYYRTCCVLPKGDLRPDCSTKNRLSPKKARTIRRAIREKIRWGRVGKLKVRICSVIPVNFGFGITK